VRGLSRIGTARNGSRCRNGSSLYARRLVMGGSRSEPKGIADTRESSKALARLIVSETTPANTAYGCPSGSARFSHSSSWRPSSLTVEARRVESAAARPAGKALATMTIALNGTRSSLGECDRRAVRLGRCLLAKRGRGYAAVSSSSIAAMV